MNLIHLLAADTPPIGQTGEMLVLLALLAILPFVLTMVTSFARVVIVGGLVRQAIGTPQIPPTTIITGLALILTVHIMSPVMLRGYEDGQALVALSRLSATDREQLRQSAEANLGRAAAAKTEGITTAYLLTDVSNEGTKLRLEMHTLLLKKSGTSTPTSPAGSSPAGDHSTWPAYFTGGHAALRDFLSRNADRSNVQLFRKLHGRLHQDADAGAKIAQLLPGAPGIAYDDFVVLVPAFILTELKKAFAIGFLIFVPFLVIELVVSNILLAMGMQMLTPNVVSLPFKLLLFLMMDGWTLIIRGLVTGYAA